MPSPTPPRRSPVRKSRHAPTEPRCGRSPIPSRTRTTRSAWPLSRCSPRKRAGGTSVARRQPSPSAGSCQLEAVTQRIARVDSEAVLSGDERRARQLRDELPAAIDEPRAEGETEEVLALDPFAGL